MRDAEHSDRPLAQRAVTLTDEEWTDLTTYILLTTKFRSAEAEAWEKLAAETNPDGSPRFPHAADNAMFWREMSAKLDRIRKQIDRLGQRQAYRRDGEKGVSPMELKQCCGTCKWHQHEDITDGWVCVNADSEYCTDFTDYDYTCQNWEGRQ